MAEVNVASERKILNYILNANELVKDEHVLWSELVKIIKDRGWDEAYINIMATHNTVFGNSNWAPGTDADPGNEPITLARSDARHALYELPVVLGVQGYDPDHDIEVQRANAWQTARADAGAAVDEWEGGGSKRKSYKKKKSRKGGKGRRTKNRR
jgi:hypothetical protein